MERSRHWCLTINNFDEDDKNKLIDVINNQCLAGIAEIEHIDEGTPHIQGYISFPNAKSRRVVSSLLPRAHLEPAKGTWKDNWRYCSKEGNIIIEKGHTLEEAEVIEKIPFEVMYKDMIDMTPHQFEMKYPKFWVMHKDKVLSIMTDHAMEKAKTWNGNLQEKNFWIWGKPGVGKSKWVTNQCPLVNQLKKNFNKWWDGYNILITHLVIIEDYPSLPSGNVLVQHMKIWGDRYPFEGECKGSHLLIEPGKFFLVVTSNYPIAGCFQNEEDIEAISRRFKEIEMKSGSLLQSSKLDFSKLEIL